MTLGLALQGDNGRWDLYADRRVHSDDGMYHDEDRKIIEIAPDVHVIAAGECLAISATLTRLRKHLGKVRKAHHDALPGMLLDPQQGPVQLLIRFRDAKRDRLVEVSTTSGGVSLDNVEWATVGSGAPLAEAIMFSTQALHEEAEEDACFRPECVDVSRLFRAVASCHLGISLEFDHA